MNKESYQYIDVMLALLCTICRPNCRVDTTIRPMCLIYHVLNNTKCLKLAKLVCRDFRFAQNELYI